MHSQWMFYQALTPAKLNNLKIKVQFPSVIWNLCQLE